MTDTSMALEDSVEQAVITWIQNVAVHGITLGIVPRQEYMDNTSELTLPAVIVKAEIREEMQPYTGVWKLMVTCALRMQADDTSEETQRLTWHNLRSILIWDDLAEQLTAWAQSQSVNLWVHSNSIIHDEASPRTEQERHWEQVFPFTCWAMSQSNGEPVVPSSSSSSSSDWEEDLSASGFVQLNGSPDPLINGHWNIIATYNGQPYYQGPSGAYLLYFDPNYQAGAWCIGTSLSSQVDSSFFTYTFTGDRAPTVTHTPWQLTGTGGSSLETVPGQFARLSG